MPRQPTPLPQVLRGRAFEISRHPDVSPARARASDVWIPTRGVRLPTHARDLRSLCAAHSLTAPKGAAFSHLTAAQLLGIPLPALDLSSEIHLSVPIGTRATRRSGVLGHQVALSEVDVPIRDGLRITTPVRTFCDLGALLDPTALVVVGDFLIRRGAPWTDIGTLAAAVESRAACRGVQRLRTVLPLLDAGSESPKETELRVLLGARGGWRLETNVTILDSFGRFVARVDLALSRLRIAIEYEGDHHRDRGQWRRDIARRRRIEAEGWIYLSVTQADLTNPAALLVDLRKAVASRL